ncbi:MULTISPECIES: DUF5713 family protein [unclassified Aureispira]|uniref:DUF5713 family protein n=1 Tax=unclassified Aureispira TaxID=2649989 RepID=UPI0006982A76|nr:MULTISPECIES: DUF5713 family protein [unclassified Aureispira]WMX13422.1 DUF5713 family protein [Aureispira sp. CCB-E]
MLNQSELKTKGIKNYKFLSQMYLDSYFPKSPVDKVKNVLLEVCFEIESTPPKDLKELYAITHRATEKINDLQNDFYDNGSEIETVARETISLDFEFIAKSYGFEADLETLVAPRDW